MAETPTHLWRGIHTSDMDPFETETGPVADVLLPTLTRKKIGTDKKTGADKFREPDVTIKDDFVQPGGGTSLFDKDKFFRGKSWGFFYIPKGTIVPPELKVTGPDWNKRFEANHYQIEAEKPLPVDVFRRALDNFARTAFAKRYTDARTAQPADGEDG